MSIELYWDYLFNNPQSQVISEMTASQLPGRQNGGAADAYRHILLSAELTRDYGSSAAFDVLTDHERETESGADNGLDMWNNSIGMQIGQYVRDNGGTWEDVVRLSRAAMVGSFDSGDFDQVSNWEVRSANDGIRQAYDEYVRQHNDSWSPLSGDPLSFDEFSSDFNQAYSFRANSNVIVLEDGGLILNSAAMTSPGNWAVHPKVLIDGEWVELSIAQSMFPTAAWFEGVGFVYEDGSAAPVLSFTADQLTLVQECFGAGTPVDMWPLDKSLKSNVHGIYDQDAVRANIWQKPIEDVSVGDIIVSFDDAGNLVPGYVPRTMTNDVKILLNFFGTRVTPGHVYYRADGKKASKFETLIDILRNDGVIQKQDGTLIRAATNVPIGDPCDGFVKASTGTRRTDGTMDEKNQGRIRLGTRFVIREGEGWNAYSVADAIEAAGGVVGDDEMIRVGGGPPMVFHWEFGDTLPNPEDFVLACSATTLEDIYHVGEWEGQRPHMPAPMVLDGGPVKPLPLADLSKMPRNAPLNFGPELTTERHQTLNRKQRKAMEAKQRKAANLRSRVLN